MAVSDYQISNVVRTYVDNLTTRGKAASLKRQSAWQSDERDVVYISEEGKKRLMEEAQRAVAEKTKRRVEGS